MKDNKILGWCLTEIATLIEMTNNKDNKTLVEAFDDFAKISGRKVMSVRNFYYKLIDLSFKDKKIADLLKNNKIFITNKTLRFDNNSTRDLIKFILQHNQKNSIRSICMEYAKGDKTKMLRYQNKYRNMLKNYPQVLEQIKQETCAKNNITVMPLNKPQVTEKEIQALFMGLVKLVKKSAEQEISTTLKREAEFANTTLQNTLIDLKRKEVLIKELREQNKKLQLKLHKAEDINKNLKNTSNLNFIEINNLAKQSKLDELREFLTKLNLQEKSQIK